MRLVVGLGNPGSRYRGTRHNVGFEVVDDLAARCAQGPSKRKFQGELNETDICGVRTGLLCPQTYMNRSGTSVQLARDFFKLPHEQILIVCDDINLPLARLRFRPKGSAGGQKGLADIIQKLGSDEVPRLRIGIGEPPDGWDATDYVLGRFGEEEIELARAAIRRAADAVRDWCCQGMEFCMNQYNAA